MAAGDRVRGCATAMARKFELKRNVRELLGVYGIELQSCDTGSSTDRMRSEGGWRR
jgi:hypothetical protein